MVDGEIAVRTDKSASAKVWRTKDDRRIPLREMTDDHIRHAMEYLRRAHLRYITSLVYLGIPAGIGELAREAAEEERAEALESKVDDLFPIFDDLMTEAIRRGLVK